MKRTRRVLRFLVEGEGGAVEQTVERDVEHAQEALSAVTEEVLRREAERKFGRVHSYLELRDYTYRANE